MAFNTRKSKIDWGFKDDQMLSSDLAIRDRIFKIKMLNNKQVKDMFIELDKRVRSTASIIKEHTGYADYYMIKCFNDIVSGGARLKTLFNKNTVGKKYDKNREGYNKCDYSFLINSHKLLHSFYAKTDMEDVKFNRVVFEELIKSFMEITGDYIDVSNEVMRGKYSQIKTLSDIEEKAFADRDSLYGVVRIIDTMWKECQEIRNNIVLPYLRYAYSLACNNSKNSLQTTENFQAGVRGLIKATSYYDFDKSTFGTYSKWWIRQCIVNNIRDSSLIKIPHSKWQNFNVLEKVRKECTSVEEIAERSGFSLHRVKDTYSNILLSQTMSLEDIVGEDDDRGNIPDNNDSKSEDGLLDNLSYLSSEERLVIGLIYEKFDIIDNTITRDDILRERSRQSV